MALLLISLDTYTAQRRIALDSGLTSQPPYGKHGILACSPHAVFETAAYLGMMAKTFVQKFPAPNYHMTLFVDDLAVQASDSDQQQCITNFAKVGAWVISNMRDTLGLPIEQETTFILGTSPELVGLAHKSAGAFGGTAASEVRNLGATYSHQHRRLDRLKKGVVKCVLTKSRVAKALHRTRRVQSLAGTRAYGTVFHTGMLQETTFGAAVCLSGSGPGTWITNNRCQTSGSVTGHAAGQGSAMAHRQTGSGHFCP
jgi:hypothetical protein